TSGTARGRNGVARGRGAAAKDCAWLALQRLPQAMRDRLDAIGRISLVSDVLDHRCSGHPVDWPRGKHRKQPAHEADRTHCARPCRGRVRRTKVVIGRSSIVKATSIINRHRVIADPPLAKFLFSDTRMAIVWLVLRVYVGYSWLDAGWHKILDSGAKTNYIIDGSGLLAFWQRIAAVPAAPAKPVILYDW